MDNVFSAGVLCFLGLDCLPSMSETPIPIPRHDLVPLRSRAEQIADELARQDLVEQPTTRQLPTAPTPVAPRLPGR